MRDIATITRKSPQERLTRLSNFAKRLLSNEEVNREIIYNMEMYVCIIHIKTTQIVHISFIYL